MRCQLIEKRIDTFRSFEIVDPVHYKSFTNATLYLQMETSSPFSTQGKEALSIKSERSLRQWQQGTQEL